MQTAQAKINNQVNWRAEWIWCKGEPQPKNFYLYVRKDFELPSKTKSAKVLVAADSRYILFVNGKYVNRGPARCDRRWEYYDEWDIAKYLKPGKNVIAALIHHYGEWTFSYMLGRGGFLCQADIECANGKTVRLQSDKTWKVEASKAWTRRKFRMSTQLEFSEIYDARKAPNGWTSIDFDDSNWQKPVLIGKPPCEPWSRLVPRDIPSMHDSLIYPVKVLDVGTLRKSTANNYLYHLDFNRIFGQTDDAVVYASTYVWSPRDGEFEICAGRDDALKIWLNDELVISHLVAYEAHMEQEIKKVNLHSGWNKILAKVIQAKGGWEMYFRFEGEGCRSLLYSPYSKDIKTATDSDIEAPWMIIGPFGSKDLKTGFDTVYPPEEEFNSKSLGEIDYTKKYSGKNDKEISWKSAGKVRQVMPISLIMYHEKRYPRLARTKISNIDGLIKQNAGSAVIDRAMQNKDGVYILIDFGKEVTGYPGIKIDNAAGGEVVDMGYAEVMQTLDGTVISPASKKIGIINPDRDDIHYADRYICKPGEQEFQTFEKRGFRYLQISIHNVTKQVKIGPVSLLFSTYPVEYRGSFECSDKRLNKVWEIGRYTVQLNMEDAYTDCPWRERGQWGADTRIEALCNYYAFGDRKLIRKALKQYAESQQPDGLTLGVYPTDRYVKLPTFTLIWVCTIWDYYLYSGDKELVRELFPNVQKALEFFDKYIDENNLLNNVPYWNFIDWANVEKKGESASINCFYYHALTTAAKIAKALGDKESEESYSERAEKVKKAINTYLWNPQVGVYEDARLDGVLNGKVSQQSNSLAIAFNVAPKKYWSKIIDYIYDSTKTVVQVGSPYFSFYALEAMYKANRYEEALHYISKRWGEMIDWGATTWWEKWQPVASFCHGWSSAPTHDLPAEFLGVKPTAPSFKELEIKPHPVYLQWAKGIVPTVGGNIKVAWRKIKAKDGFEMTIEIPSNCTAEIFVPFEGRNRIKVNGKVNPALWSKNINHLTDETGYARFRIRKGGKYKFQIE